MNSGKKYLIEKIFNVAFIKLKFKMHKLPGCVILDQIQKFRPVLSYINKRMGRKYNPVPIPINYRRQYIISLRYLTNYIKSIVYRTFNDQLTFSINTLVEVKRNLITRAVATDIKYLAEARFYSHLR